MYCATLVQHFSSLFLYNCETSDFRKEAYEKDKRNMTNAKFIAVANDVKTKALKFMVQSKSLYYFPSDATSPSFVFALCLAL